VRSHHSATTKQQPAVSTVLSQQQHRTQGEQRAVPTQIMANNCKNIPLPRIVSYLHHHFLAVHTFMNNYFQGF